MADLINGGKMKITNFKYLSADRVKKVAVLEPKSTSDGTNHYEMRCPITQDFICSFSLRPEVAVLKKRKTKKD